VVFQARLATSLPEASSLLSSVELGPNDFAWLGDIRTLAQAEAAFRFGDRDAESAAVTQYLKRQALLIEPFHAFYFGLLTYQERLKPIYQRRASVSAVIDGTAR